MPVGRMGEAHDDREWSLGAGEAGLVSVVVPTYNRAELIPETLEAIAAQTYEPVEVVVVDDGGSDNTEEVVKDRPGVMYIRQENAGAPVARNTGILASRGEFIQFLDSDDLIAPAKLAEQVARLQACPDTRIVYGDSYRFVHPERDSIRTRVEGAPRDKLKWHLGSLRALCLAAAPLWRRSEVARVGPWDARLSSGQDWDYMLRGLLGDDGRRGVLYAPGAAAYHRLGEYGSITTPLSRDFDEKLANAMYLVEEAAHLLEAAGRATARTIGPLCLRSLNEAESFARKGFPGHAREYARRVRAIAETHSAGATARVLMACERLLGERQAQRIWRGVTLARLGAQRLRLKVGLA